MNTLLHFADSALQYSRGKQTGLWGLMGIAIAILSVATWDDFIQPTFEFLGIVSLFDNLGLVVKDAPGLTTFKILIAILAFYFAIIVIGLVIAGIYITLFTISENPFGKFMLKASLYLIFSPFVLLYKLCQLIGWCIDASERRKDPVAYEERKRIEKNYEVIEYMKNEGNVISYEEAFNRLNRLPSKGDHFFLVGITHERDIYMLLPRVLDTIGFDKGEVFCEKVKINLKKQYINKEIIKEIEPKIIVDNIYNDSYKIPRIDFTNFVHLIDPSPIKELNSAFSGYGNSSLYLDYVQYIQNQFFNRKDKLLEELVNEQTNEQYNNTLKEIQPYHASNEDIVRMIWEANNKELID
ncbi:hypothetical protein VBD025_00825 [Virgibacillus flavescens]|uniref:hypothetical protein n=1 Tax=Virgibacillus flavescens TaxID=1611422 RepID=UPI003D3411A7